MSVYSEAYSHVSNVRGFVTDAITDARSWANQARSAAESTLSSLGSFNPDFTSAQSPESPQINLTVDGSFDLPEINATSFGQITAALPGAPSFSPVRDMPTLNIPGFTPSITALNIPDAPEPGTFTAPVAPSIPTITLPDAPSLDMPLMPQLEQITIPVFDFNQLPTFSADAPEFQDSPVSTVMQWTEQPYQTEVMDEVIAKLRDIWAGGNGIPVAVEQALWERAAEREDIDLRRALSDLDVDFSSRGFTQPPGVLQAQKQALREESMLRKQTASRDIAIRMAEIHVENVRFACEQGVAAENVYLNIWQNMAQRQFEAAKIQLDSQLALYNARVSLFNAKQQAYGVKAEVWKAELDGQLQIMRTQLEAEQAKGQLNEQQVRVYGEKIKALMANVEIYKAEMQGAATAADVSRNVIERFKAEVSAYAEQVQADRAKFDAYDSRVKGELGKAQILDAEARAYSAYVSGQASVADIHAKRTDSDLRKNEFELRAYLGELDAAKARIQAESEQIRASASAYAADTQRYQAQAGAEGDRLRVELAAREVEIRSTIGFYEAEVKRYMADIERMVSIANAQLEALKASGQVSSTMAAGAMAGINIGASLSGGGNVSASGNSSSSQTRNGSWNYSYSVDGDTGPSPSGWPAV